MAGEPEGVESLRSGESCELSCVLEVDLGTPELLEESLRLSSYGVKIQHNSPS